ncbi:MAG TPA: PadR family transcriptional regulator [Gemmatimonadales bacterium]|nr:PadR family transcriptional regulator [Gemmatimonadales bacterium]
MNPLDYHVLLALAGGPLHGYAIKEAVAAESAGTLAPPAGTLYRVIARLVSNRLVVETATPSDAEPHPGLSRRYYTLTAAGRRALEAESRRLKQTAAVAARRLRLASGRS